MQLFKRFISPLFIIIPFLLASPGTFAQQLSIRTSVGFVYLPLNDWSRFFSGFSNSFYSKNNPNLYYGLSLHYSINSTHAINIGTELIKSSASLSGSTGLGTIDWKFQGIPLTAGYEYRMLNFNEHFTIILGAGVSYFISEAAAHDDYFNFTSKRYGNGYGIHSSAGLNAELTRQLSLISQIRFRYSDGMGFTDKKGSIKVEFTGFDFSTGLSWTF